MTYNIRRLEDGQWFYAAGGEFPVSSTSIPLWSRFRRLDTGDDYEWNGTAWVSEGGTGAPDDAEYITAGAEAGLSAERALTDTATVTWDFGTAGQAKANAASAPAPDSDAQTIASLALLGF